MTTRRPALVALACVALFGEMIVGCADTAEPIPVDVYAEEDLTVDLLSQEYDVGGTDVAAKESTAKTCEVTVLDMPPGARIGGLRLHWTPSKDQLGIYDIVVEYGSGCQGMPDPRGHFQIQVHDLTIMASTGSSATPDQSARTATGSRD